MRQEPVDLCKNAIDIASHKLYYVNLEIRNSNGHAFLFQGPSALPAIQLSRLRAQSHASEFAGLVFRGFLLLQFILDVLLDQVGVGAYNAAAIDEDGGGAGDLEG